MRTVYIYTLTDKATGEVLFHGTTKQSVEAGLYKNDSALANLYKFGSAQYAVERELVEYIPPVSEKPCEMCGEPFVGNIYTRYCENCAAERAKKKQKDSHHRIAEPRGLVGTVKYKPRCDGVSELTAYVREIDAYNASNGTHLSYGRYAAGYRK